MLCRTCGEEFKTYLKVDGKLINLCSRKHCTKCSPLYAHNTRKELTKTLSGCLICGRDLTGNQIKYCSKKCKQKDPKHTENNYATQQERGQKRRVQLIDLLGGRCSICGYSKCYASLEFHHRDPTEKKIQLDIRRCANNSIKVLLAEVKKCDLLCANCHRELHNA